MALIRLQGCAGWSMPLLSATPEDKFSHSKAQIVSDKLSYRASEVSDILNPCSLTSWTGTLPGHVRLLSCIMSTSASKGKWQVGAQYFLLLRVLLKKNGMLFDCRNSLPSKFVKGIEQPLKVVFDTKTAEMNLAKGGEKQWNFHMNAWLIEPVWLNAAV